MYQNQDTSLMLQLIVMMVTMRHRTTPDIFNLSY